MKNEDLHTRISLEPKFEIEKKIAMRTSVMREKRGTIGERQCTDRRNGCLFYFVSSGFD